MIKGGVFLEELARIKVVPLDKTGTLTRGEPEVTDVLGVPGSTVSPEDATALAVAVESRSQHPLAVAVTRYGKAKGISVRQVDGFQSVTGAGASGVVEGREVLAGSPAYFEKDLGVDLSSVTTDISRLQDEGKTVIIVGDKAQAWALIAIRDTARANAREAVRKLHAVGIAQVVMLTGDNRRTADAIGKEVGVDAVYADLKPDDKARIIRELSAQHGHVAMVGDGVNDAPALAEATVGIAMGAAGTDVALETADVALMADDLEKLVYALELAKRNARVVQQNLALSVLVIGVLVVGAVLGRFSLPVAVIGHELSEFVVIASGLRMLRA